LAGLVAFVVCAGLAGSAVAAWAQSLRPLAPLWWIAVAPPVAALVAGLVETTRVRLDDNISVPAAAALVLWTMAAVDAPTFLAAWPEVVTRIGPGLAWNGGAAALGWSIGAVTVPGALTGLLIGAAIYAGAGPGAWVLLLVCFAAAVIATRAGRARKTRLGIAEERSGRRGPGNAIANTGVAAWIALLIPGLITPDTAMIAMAAALVTGASDTVASEIGKAWGRVTWLVVGFRRVPPGTSGAASLEGTTGGFVAAASLAAIAAALGAMPAGPAAVVIVTMAATAAAFAESVMGATLEESGVLHNDALNFINTAIGAGLAALAWQVI
jgi:uncharacterized protein (TIGR00297 family)